MVIVMIDAVGVETGLSESYKHVQVGDVIGDQVVVEREWAWDKRAHGLSKPKLILHTETRE